MGNLLNIRGPQKELRPMEFFLFTEPSKGRDFRKLTAQRIHNETCFDVKRRKQSYRNLRYYTCTGFRRANTKTNDDHVELNAICKVTKHNFLCNLRIFTKSDCLF